MATIGIDLGSSRLRAWMERAGAPVRVDHRWSTARLPIRLEADPGPAAVTRPEFRAASLKRLLHRDCSSPGSPFEAAISQHLAAILRDLWEDCRAREAVDELGCVLAVPACFAQRQRAILRGTAAAAGFRRVKLVDDTQAALLASDGIPEETAEILVFAWGASTLSVALYKRIPGGYQPLALEGDRELGGDDLTAEVSETILSEVSRAAGGPPAPLGRDAFERIFGSAEEAKPALAEGGDVTLPLSRVLGRQVPGEPALVVPAVAFADSLRRMLGTALTLVEKVLAGRNGQPRRPGLVLAVGGMASLPAVLKALEERCGCPAKAAPDEAVARGALIYGERLGEAGWGDAEAAAAPGAPAGPARGRPKQGARWADDFIPLLDRAQELSEQGFLGEFHRAFQGLFLRLGKFAAVCYRESARRLDEAGHREEALGLLREANRHDPSNKHVALDLARILIPTGDSLARFPGKALAAAEEAIRILRPLAAGEADCRVLLEDWTRIQRSVRTPQKGFDILGPLQGGVRALASLFEPGRKRPGRNDPCPCGSGKKFKKCCGLEGGKP